MTAEIISKEVLNIKKTSKGEAVRYKITAKGVIFKDDPLYKKVTFQEVTAEYPLAIEGVYSYITTEIDYSVVEL